MTLSEVLEKIPPTSRRVEQSTDPTLNQMIQRRSDVEVARLEQADDADLSTRIQQLEQEWDIERTLQLNASVLAFSGSMLGYTTRNRRYFLVPTVIFGFFLQHALQGWCPPIPIFRRLGVRTQREIERERYALKLLRGDFESLSELPKDDLNTRVRGVLQAIDA